MNLELFTAVAELLGAFAVVAPLVYWGVQARTMRDVPAPF
jgi:hypothetical protein